MTDSQIHFDRCRERRHQRQPYARMIIQASFDPNGQALKYICSCHQNHHVKPFPIYSFPKAIRPALKSCHLKSPPNRPSSFLQTISIPSRPILSIMPSLYLKKAIETLFHGRLDPTFHLILSLINLNDGIRLRGVLGDHGAVSTAILLSVPGDRIIMAYFIPSNDCRVVNKISHLLRPPKYKYQWMGKQRQQGIDGPWTDKVPNSMMSRGHFRPYGQGQRPTVRRKESEERFPAGLERIGGDG